MQCFEQLPHPLILLTDGLQNSLAAALEIPRDHVRQYIENRLGLCPEG